MMKHSVTAITMLLLLCHMCAWGEGFRLDVGHFDPQAGLSANVNSESPLSDGCLGQVIEDVGNDGIAIPAVDGAPGAGDLLMSNHAQNGLLFTFAVNGATRLNMPGCFLIAPGFAGDTLPLHRIFIRVWNSPSALQATGYWDSPLYDILPGGQQISFLRGEWHWSNFTSSTRRDAALPLSSALTAFPNPFNSSSRITFVLQMDEHARLSLYDLQARLVATLIDAPLARGRHDLVFNGSALPSGLYFLRLQAGHEVSQVTRLLLIR
jgi:hypothetical protein